MVGVVVGVVDGGWVGQAEVVGAIGWDGGFECDDDEVGCGCCSGGGGADVVVRGGYVRP